MVVVVRCRVLNFIIYCQSLKINIQNLHCHQYLSCPLLCFGIVGRISNLYLQEDGNKTTGTSRHLQQRNSWSECKINFENTAAVNERDTAKWLQWLRVRLMGRAQKALQSMTMESFEDVIKALDECFEPKS